MKTRLVLFFFFLYTGLSCLAKERYVILRAQKTTQEDTLGYNLVEQLPAAIYKGILENRIHLWDSPSKKIQIQPAALKDLEKSFKYPFTSLDNFFVYEIWLIKGKNLTVTTQGILFATKTQKGEEINFGFVDFTDLQDILGRSYLDVNANGFLNMSMEQVLTSKRYNYSIVQYGKKLITSTVESEKIKKEDVRGKKWTKAVAPIPQVKSVSYFLTGGTKQRTRNTLIDTLEHYFQRNLEEYLNIGADRFTNMMEKGVKVKIDTIVVEEVWFKAGEAISYEPQKIILKVNKMALDELSMVQLLDRKIKVEGMTVADYLTSKGFTYQLCRINTQKINEKDSPKYLEALRKGDWIRISNFVNSK